METFYNDAETKVTCPYDKSHFIRKSRMAVHLVKCAKNHQDADIVVCDFNANHRLHKSEQRYHHEICPDRFKIESQIIEREYEPLNVAPIPTFMASNDDEDWDKEDAPTYNPQAYCEQNNILRKLDVESAAKRRNFRYEERMRHCNLNVGEVKSEPQHPQPSQSHAGGAIRVKTEIKSEEIVAQQYMVDEDPPLDVSNLIRLKKSKIYSNN